MEDRGLKTTDSEGGARALRLFIAITVPDAVKDEIEKAQRELRAAVPGDFIRWTKREQFHLTLKFLGNVAELRVGELIENLRGACAQFAALRLRAERIGYFPDVRFPRVVWVWVHDDKEALPRLQNVIEIGVASFSEPAGVPPASRENAEVNSPAGRRRSQETFTGHVTLGRIQRVKRPQAESLAKLARGMAKRFFGEWLAGEVELVRSDLSSKGSRYTTLASIPLSGAI
jgi:2'-5' RNA ligase